jgi:hypothetical protein
MQFSALSLDLLQKKNGKRRTQLSNSKIQSCGSNSQLHRKKNKVMTKENGKKQFFKSHNHID